jgi:acetyl esterase
MNTSVYFPHLKNIKIRVLPRTAVIIILLLLSGSIFAKNPIIPESDTVVVYKKIDTLALKLFLYYPPGAESKGTSLPAIVFFFGGGWNGGNITQFEPQAKHFASLGMVTILADYRVRERHGTTPFDAVSDAKSVFRYLRKNSEALQINPAKIVGSGGSAGGHIAAAAAMVPALDCPEDDILISPVPDALVLFNPVFDNGPDGYGFERVKDRYMEISPIHNIKQGNPPTLVFLGSQDRLIPVSTAERFCNLMKDSGNICELHIYEGQGHGFFNHRNRENYNRTVTQTENFLRLHGYIQEK